MEAEREKDDQIIKLHRALVLPGIVKKKKRKNGRAIWIDKTLAYNSIISDRHRSYQENMTGNYSDLW